MGNGRPGQESKFFFDVRLAQAMLGEWLLWDGKI